ncbi:MAG: HAD family hydrolase [Candidatus Chloroheliales bacterium]|nr:MAG: HAD family hydrolase [Chloroflexota bacterium]
MIKAVIFDIDGTLMDTNGLHIIAWERAFKRGGYSVSPERIAIEVGKGGDHLVPAILGEAQSKADEEEQERIRKAHDEEYTKIANLAKPFPSAEQILARLHQRGLKVALASSASEEEVKRYLGYLNADKNVDVVVSKSDVESSKPAPDVFSVALKKLGLKSNQAVAIGDTPYDISAARKLELPCVAVLSGGFDRQQLEPEGPVAIFASVAELQAHLDELIELKFDQEQR